MTQNAPGKAFRKGLTLHDACKMFPDNEAARKWFENIRWPNGEVFCPHCGSDNVMPAKHKNDALPLPREAVQETV